MTEAFWPVHASADPVAGTIEAAVRLWSFRFQDEDELQVALAYVLTRSGFDVQREVVLGPRNRVDLLIGRTGVEVKVKGTKAEVVRQLTRYARSDLIDDLVLVSPLSRHWQMPATVGGKPLLVVRLACWM